MKVCGKGAKLIPPQVLCCTATLAWGVNLPAHAGVFRQAW